jgi:hypothetical protein
MISYEDCIGMCGLTKEEVLAIAEHEHIPEMAAAALAHYILCKNKHGAEVVRDMIVDDIKASRARNDLAHSRQLLHVLHHFLREHPEARPVGSAAQ